jgi:4-alpha-glucanotransferase
MRAFAEKRLCGLYTVLATLPGVPSIFYGDEAGLEGYHDPFNRMPYPWGRESKDLICHYKKIGKIRRENTIYKKGTFGLIHFDCDLLVFKRSNGNECYITVFNNSEDTINISFVKKVKNLISEEIGKNFGVDSYNSAVFKTDSSNKIDFFKAN